MGHISLGTGCLIEDGATIGYLPSRAVADLHLQLGENARVRRGSILYLGTRIGRNLETGHGVVIREQNRIGNDLKIWNYSTVDYGCIIGNRVKIHAYCYVAQYTTLEDDVFLAPGVMIANDIHPGCEKSNECMRGPTICRGARIGVNATIVPYVTVGAEALVGAGAVVTRDVPPRSVVVGNPARVVKQISELACDTGMTTRPYP